MKEISSSRYYTQVGPHYREISRTRSEYIKAVDILVAETAKSIQIKRWLDIGTGNGDRLLRLVEEIKADEVVGLEPCDYMFKEASRNLEGKCIVIDKTLEAYSEDESKRFSFVTALWNVIGHSCTPANFITGAYSLLEKGGFLVIDANNRYNLRQYGVLSVLRNAVMDFLGLGTNGVFKLRAGNTNNFTRVYIASPYEIRRACQSLDGANIEISFLDYNTGEPASCLTGQIIARVYKG